MYPLLSEPFFLEPAGDKRTSDTGILLIHGFTGSPENMREMAQFFADQGHVVYNMRIAGHGTHPDDLNKTSSQEWLHSAEDAIHFLRDHTSRIVVLGFSFGGNLAMHVATRFPDLISHVVVMGTPVRLRKHWRAQMNIALYHLLGLPYIFTTIRYRNMTPIVEANGVYTIWPTVASKKLLHFLKTGGRATIKRVTQPLMVVQSLEDRIVHPKSAMYIYNNAPSRRKEILWMNNAHHYPLNGSQRDGVYEKIYAFIQKS